MWMLSQVWFWLFLASGILIFIGAIGGSVQYKKRMSLWEWILIDIGIFLFLVGLFFVLVQVSMKERKINKEIECIRQSE